MSVNQLEIDIVENNDLEYIVTPIQDQLQEELDALNEPLIKELALILHEMGRKRVKFIFFDKEALLTNFLDFLESESLLSSANIVSDFPQIYYWIDCDGGNCTESQRETVVQALYDGIISEDAFFDQLRNTSFEDFIYAIETQLQSEGEDRGLVRPQLNTWSNVDERVQELDGFEFVEDQPEGVLQFDGFTTHSNYNELLKQLYFVAHQEVVDEFRIDHAEEFGVELYNSLSAEAAFNLFHAEYKSRMITKLKSMGDEEYLTQLFKDRPELQISDDKFALRLEEQQLLREASTEALTAFSQYVNGEENDAPTGANWDAHFENFFSVENQDDDLFGEKTRRLMEIRKSLAQLENADLSIVDATDVAIASSFESLKNLVGAVKDEAIGRRVQKELLVGIQVKKTNLITNESDYVSLLTDDLNVEDSAVQQKITDYAIAAQLTHDLGVAAISGNFANYEDWVAAVDGVMSGWGDSSDAETALGLTAGALETIDLAEFQETVTATFLAPAAEVIESETSLSEGEAMAVAFEAFGEDNSFLTSELSDKVEAFMSGAELLTAVSALRDVNVLSSDAGEGIAGIKGAIRNVGVSSYGGLDAGGYVFADSDELVRGEDRLSVALSNTTDPSLTYFDDTAFRFESWTARDAVVDDADAFLAAKNDININNHGHVFLMGGSTLSADNNFTADVSNFWVVALNNTGIGVIHNAGPALSEIDSGVLKGRVWNNTTKEFVTNTSIATLSRLQIDPTSVIAGNQLNIRSRYFKNYAGSLISAGDILISSKLTASNKAVRTNFVLGSKHGCKGKACGRIAANYAAAEILAGGDLIISAKNIEDYSSHMAAENSIILSSKENIAMRPNYSKFAIVDVTKKKRFFGIVYKKKRQYNEDVNIYTSSLSTVTGGISLIVGQDLSVTGSHISAGGDISINVGNDVLFDALSVEVLHKASCSGICGFLAIGKSSTVGNNFGVSLASVTGRNINITADNNITAIGATLMAQDNISLSAGQTVTFDAEQNERYLKESGWSFGISFKGASILEAGLTGNGVEDLFDAFIANNPTLAAVSQLSQANNRYEYINAGLAVAWELPKMLNAARGIALSDGVDPEIATTGFGALAAQFNPFDGVIEDLGIFDPKKPFWEGITFRLSVWESSQDWTESHLSRVASGQDLIIDAGKDIALMGGTVASAGRDVILTATETILTSALADTFSSRSNSWGISLGFSEDGATFGMDGSKSKGKGTNYTNAQLTAGGDLITVSGLDTLVLGANWHGSNVWMDVGRDLVVQSRQNYSKNNSASFGFSVTVGPVTSVSINGALSNGLRRYSDTPTMITAGLEGEDGTFSEGTLDIYVENDTYLLGSLINSKTGDLKLDTNTLSFDNMNDTDKYDSVNFGITVTGGVISNGSFGLSHKLKTGITYATVGEGEIIIRDQTGLDPGMFALLNRDPANLQVTIKDEYFDIQIPGLNLKNWWRNVEGAGNFVEGLFVDIPSEYASQGAGTEHYYRIGVYQGLSGTNLTNYLSSPETVELIRQVDNLSELKRKFALLGQKIPPIATLLILKGFEVKIGDNLDTYHLELGGCSSQTSEDDPCDSGIIGPAIAAIKGQIPDIMKAASDKLEEIGPLVVINKDTTVEELTELLPVFDVFMKNLELLQACLAVVKRVQDNIQNREHYKARERLIEIHGENNELINSNVSAHPDWASAVAYVRENDSVLQTAYLDWESYESRTSVLDAIRYFDANEEDISFISASYQIAYDSVPNNTRKIWGGVQFVAGIVEVGGGATAIVISEGAALLPGSLVIYSGLDDIETGWRQVFSGLNESRNTYQALFVACQAIGLHDCADKAGIADFAVSLVGSGGLARMATNNGLTPVQINNRIVDINASNSVGTLKSVPASVNTWNQFQAVTKGQFVSRIDAAKGWELYKQANGIETGAVRSIAARSLFLKQLGASGKAPKWMNQFLSKGKVPPGYNVDHILPISAGGADSPVNMRLKDIATHVTRHRYYRPWE